jgi:hypothetical protein
MRFPVLCRSNELVKETTMSDQKTYDDGDKVDGLAPKDSPLRPDKDASPTEKPSVEEAKLITGRDDE